MSPFTASVLQPMTIFTGPLDLYIQLCLFPQRSSIFLFFQRCERSAHAEGRDLEHCTHDQEQQNYRPQQDPKDLQSETNTLNLSL